MTKKPFPPQAVSLWQELSREQIFSKYGRGLEKRVYRLPKGNDVEFYLKSGSDSVACLALTTDQKVILVKQFRPGPAQVLLELPGGGQKTGESPEEATHRELLEETGYRGNMRYVGQVIPCAYATYRKHFLVATECEKIAEPQLEENGEELQVVLLSLDEFRVHLRGGQMTDVEGAYLGLDFLKLL